MRSRQSNCGIAINGQCLRFCNEAVIKKRPVVGRNVNDFVVVERGDWDPFTNKMSNRKAAPMRSYSDTETIPWNAYMRFRTHLADSTGRSIYHCHLLFHEDHGMMGAFDIVDANGEGAGPSQHLPSHH